MVVQTICNLNISEKCTGRSELTINQQFTMLTSITSLSHSSFLLGLGLGVAGTSILSRIMNKQISDAALDNEDNESGGEAVK